MVEEVYPLQLITHPCRWPWSDLQILAQSAHTSLIPPKLCRASVTVITVHCFKGTVTVLRQL